MLALDLSRCCQHESKHASNAVDVYYPCIYETQSEGQKTAQVPRTRSKAEAKTNTRKNCSYHKCGTPFSHLQMVPTRGGLRVLARRPEAARREEGPRRAGPPGWASGGATWIPLLCGGASIKFALRVLITSKHIFGRSVRIL